MIHLKITPDSRLDNKNVEHLAQSLCIYLSPLERWNGKGFNRSPFMSFETILEKGNTQYVLTVPKELESLAKKTLETTWSKSAVEVTEDPFTLPPVLTSQLSYNYHYMFSLKVDKRSLGAIPSMLETINALEKNEKIYIQTISTPAERDWFVSAANAYERFRKGEMPQKLKFDKKQIASTSVKIAAYVALEAASITTELITGKEMEKVDLNSGERAMILKDGKLSSATLNKTKGDAYVTEIRIGVVAPPNRAMALMRMVTMSFRELDGENYLLPYTTKPKKAWEKMMERKIGGFINKDYFSIPEISRFHLLPTGDLQEKYHIPHIDNLELEIPKILTKEGLYLGDAEVKKKKIRIYESIKNHDILCLPRIVIGGMGSGKTKGYAANFIVECVKNGFGALAIDPAKGEIYKEVSTVLNSDWVTKIQLGEVPFSLDWREVERSPKAKNRLANTILGFFHTSNEEAGAQTSRYIRAAVMAMKTGKLSEIIRIFEDNKYRENLIQTMPNSLHKLTLENFGKESEKRRAQILSPIYNRLDIILGDQYLSECMESNKGIDLVEIMEQKKAVIINVPKKELGPEAVDLIASLISSKLDLAMTLRDEEKQHPFFAVYDEPHQFLKSAKTWKSAAVESRKWRLGYVWLFHSWEQIPNDLAEIIKAAGPHYIIYNSSKKTFKDLAEEITPFTVQDGLKLKLHHAINVLRAGNGIQKPFLAMMAEPPSLKKTPYYGP
ncbi:ATP-binding protein [Bacillus sp. EB600]|uniref:ATP-binding protein n=1 Tax=Bacillus sp. EB600 TaxID=2806345 RepID=UPI00210E97D3|nr:ATP-binding protein [Bacillus sp. EB600]MCQ6281106.1 ATP-binding protein [Bacillus sp. EB600]